MNHYLNNMTPENIGNTIICGSPKMHGTKTGPLHLSECLLELVFDLGVNLYCVDFTVNKITF